MNTKSFRNLVQDKTGLTDYEYHQLFDALEEKYGVTEADIAGQIPEKLGFVDTDMALTMGLPNTSQQDVVVTREDISVAEKLDIEPKIVGKITQWGEATSERLETLDNMPFGVGDEIRAVIEQNGIDEFMGSQRDIAKAIDDRLAPAVENTAEGATADAQKEEKISIWDNIKERFEGREVEDHSVVIESKYDYYNDEAGVALKGVGDNMRVYLINEDGEAQHIGSVPCAKEDRAEFVSEYQEKVDVVANTEDNWFNSKERVALGAAEAVSNDIAEEKEIGTGNWFTDITRERTQEKHDELEEKIENMQEKIDDMGDGWLKDSMTKLLEKAQEELTQYEEQLDKFDQMEIENAKEIKAQVEAAKAELAEQMERVDNMNFLPDGIKEKIKSQYENQMDELDDRLSAVNEHLAATTNLTSETVNEAKEDNHNWIEDTKDKIEEKAQDVKEWLTDAISDARASAQTFVANVDNIIGGVKDDVAEWANGVANNEHVKNFSETTSNFYNDIQDDLDGIKNAAKDFGKDISKDADNLWSDIKDFAQDVGKDISDKWENALDDAKDWANNIADKFDFGNENDTSASIDD